jgi:hypothetical protein
MRQVTEGCLTASWVRNRQEIENSKRLTLTDSSALPAFGDSSDVFLVGREQQPVDGVMGSSQRRRAGQGLACYCRFGVPHARDQIPPATSAVKDLGSSEFQ